jgi:hypothetical protein
MSGDYDCDDMCIEELRSMNGDCDNMCLEELMGRSRERSRMGGDSNRMDGDFDCDDMCIQELYAK